MKAMNLKNSIGIVMGLIGTLFSLLHLVLMMFAGLGRRYHAAEIWALSGFMPATAGLLLLIAGKNEDGK